MREYRDTRTVPTLVTLIVIGFLVMTLDIRASGGGLTGTLRDGTTRLLAPVQRVAAAIVNPLADFMEGLADIADLRAENADLRSRLASVQAELASVQDSLERLEVLERLNDLTLDEADLIQTPANVIGRTDSFDLSFRIDKGEADGVLAGHPVIDENGYLVGRVLSATAHGAVVVPIVGDREAVTVVAGGRIGSLSAILGSGQMRLDVFDTPDPMPAGTQVVTSFQSVSFPPGIPVGEVVETVKPVGGALRATVEPFSDLSRLRVVVVLTWPPDPTAVTETPPTTVVGDGTGGGDAGSAEGGDGDHPGGGG